MKLIIVRHGQTDYNALGIMQGRKGKPLNITGWEQVRKLSLRLKNEKIDVAYVSNLERTQETAREILSAHQNIPVIYTKELQERSYGIYDGKHRDIYLSARKKSALPHSEFKPEGGESVVEARERALKFYTKLQSKHQKDTVLIVSHGGLIRALLAVILDESFASAKDSKIYLHNSAVTILNIDKGNVVMEAFNCVKHLE